MHKFLLHTCILILPLCAMGQGFGFSDHVYLSPVPRVPVPITPLIPTNLIAGGFLWYVASDLTNGPVNSWTDRINHVVVSMGNSANIPYKTNDYVTFTNVNQVLTNRTVQLNEWFNTGHRTFIVVMSDETSASQYIFGLGSSTFAGFRFDQANPPGMNSWDGANMPTWVAPCKGNLRDIMVIFKTPPTCQSLTNNIQANINGIAFFAAGGFTGFSIGNRASDSGGVGIAPAKIRELLLYTNDISSIDASNYHYYATNLYLFTP